MLSNKQHITKRIFDLFFAFVGLVIFCIPLITLIFIASFSTHSFGIFSQKRVGKNAKLFMIYKIKSMLQFSSGEFVITKFGQFLRRSRIDELPQLFNVVMGTMSFVGPRPDIQGYADKLKIDDQIILSVKPGITGPATIKYSKEDALLLLQDNPLAYNDSVIWPDKIKINKQYIANWSLISDFKYLLKSILLIFH